MRNFPSLYRATSVTINYGATVRTSPKFTQTVASKNFIQHESYQALLIRNDISLIDTDRVVCVDTTSKASTCQGDSGGPLALEGVLIGATSFGSSSGCEAGLPAAFTNVSYFRSWIKTNAGI